MKKPKAKQDRHPKSRGKPLPSGPGVQGEGDYISGRAYQQDAKRFAEQHDTEQLARDAAPKNDAERREMIEAEKMGKSRAKGRKPPRP